MTFDGENADAGPTTVLQPIKQTCNQLNKDAKIYVIPPQHKLKVLKGRG